MYAIPGVTGHVGGAAARELLRRGEQVRAVVRDPAKGAEWAAAGAEVAVADLGDRKALAEALRDCAGAFVLLPTDTAAADPDAAHRATAETIADAVRDSGVPHVVALSSVGADLAEGTGPIRWLHHLENVLRATGAQVTAVRSGHFQEKVELILGAVLGAGVYPVFAESADVPTPMIATRDIGSAVADLLDRPRARLRGRRPRRPGLQRAPSRRGAVGDPRPAAPSGHHPEAGLGRRDGRRRPPAAARGGTGGPVRRRGARHPPAQGRPPPDRPRPIWRRPCATWPPWIPG